NPSLLAKQAGDLDPRDVLKEICSLVDGPVSAEVVGLETDGMVREGSGLAKIADNIVVKIPMTEAGMVAVRRLATDGIKTNVTLCFSSVQCLIAAKAGATYVSPFIGRLDVPLAAGPALRLPGDAGVVGRAAANRPVAAAVARAHGGRAGAGSRHPGSSARGAPHPPGRRRPGARRRAREAVASRRDGAH